MADTGSRGPGEPSLCLLLKFMVFYSNIMHTEPLRYGIPSTKGTVGESNLSNENMIAHFVQCTAVLPV